MKVLVTCPPMLGMIDNFRPIFEQHSVELTTPGVVQTLSVEELTRLVPQHDGWIIGDDPATHEVFAAGKAGRLKAAVKWGVGVDNVDFAACRALGIQIANTPDMFGNEVADIAMGYVIALAREIFEIDLGVRAGEWPKPRGISLAGKVVALVGFGDIGKATAKRLLAAGMRVIVYDPNVQVSPKLAVESATWPEHVEEADFIVITCSLTPSSRYMVNTEVLEIAKRGVRIVNVGRGPVICEPDLVAALRSGKVYSAALDVFEDEPLPLNSPLRRLSRCLFGSHNASNTVDAVERTSHIAIQKLFNCLGIHS
ncbi:MAG: phosphoglycerate dehydrogenase [Candidatus Polarisedimenticolaceae bacterium]|nr:phosphoglycerate dehydrogenase [Candidatus Polarisedimenticolaceae bacterium]